MQPLDGRSLLPLLKSDTPKWEDRKLFIHIGRWKKGEREAAKYGKYAVRTQQWRFVNNKELYDISIDRSEKHNLADKSPHIVHNLRTAYDKWWKTAVPLMVNENLPKIKTNDYPLVIRYHKQLKEHGIPLWSPDEI
jgi:arylsulfatase